MANTLTRIEHWRTRAYHHYLRDRARQPFKWGVNDCALFAADGIQAQTGMDIAADFRGKYHDEDSAFAAIKEITGGTTVADAAVYCASQHGMRENIHPLMAQRGDLVVLEDAGQLIAGLVHLSGRDIAVVGEGGLKRIPITAIKRSWKVSNV